MICDCENGLTSLWWMCRHMDNCILNNGNWGWKCLCGHGTDHLVDMMKHAETCPATEDLRAEVAANALLQAAKAGGAA